jgi:hypothetical protein
MDNQAPPRALCGACLLQHLPLDGALCVACEKAAGAKVEQLTRQIQAYERRYDRAFVRTDEVELTEADFIIETSK